MNQAAQIAEMGDHKLTVGQRSMTCIGRLRSFRAHAPDHGLLFAEGANARGKVVEM